jgi:hypothetical protein
MKQNPQLNNNIIRRIIKCQEQSKVDVRLTQPILEIMVRTL